MMMAVNLIELDGAQGEGGGQVLRTALTLSMITGRPFRIQNIRANRPKQGLMRQHLVAVMAAAEICGAELSQAALGSLALEFRPGKIRAGSYGFSIGSAGSCTLVLQTLLPALLYADGASQVQISGGTHNPMAPPANFLQRSYVRAMADMGALIELDLVRHGFYPAGGGELHARVLPCARLKRMELMSPGARRESFAESVIAGVPARVARRELECIQAGMGWSEAQHHMVQLPDEQGPGNVALITLGGPCVATYAYQRRSDRALSAGDVHLRRRRTPQHRQN
jgi:RNA 3'-terminal phosphate cyclase (ATP)